MANRPEPTQNHENISYTARGVAFARSLSDIPFSKDIAEYCDADVLSARARRVYVELSPYFEARFKAINKLLENDNYDNILELASGFSPRGLILAEDDDINYVETDLPNVISAKEKLLQRLAADQSKTALPKNLHFQALNVLDEQAFLSIVRQFPPGSIAIVHEGLLAYFTHSEKRTLAKIIHAALSERGGVWITTDVFTRADLKKTAPTKDEEDAVRELLADTGRDYQANAFTDLETARQFFAELGFKASVRDLRSVAGPIASSSHSPSQSHLEDQLSLNIWKLAVA